MAEATQVEVQIDEPYVGRASSETLRRVAEMAIIRERRRGPRRVSISVIGDEELRDLNRRFRGEDSVTDVLAFGNEDAAPGSPAEDDSFVLGPEEKPSLGDVVISFPQAERQAGRAGRPVEHELALLTAHGVLHLLGFDHAEPGEEAEMFAKTDRILAEVLGPEAVPMAPAPDAASQPAAEDG